MIPYRYSDTPISDARPPSVAVLRSAPEVRTSSGSRFLILGILGLVVSCAVRHPGSSDAQSQRQADASNWRHVELAFDHSRWQAYVAQGGRVFGTLSVTLDLIRRPYPPYAQQGSHIDYGYAWLDADRGLLYPDGTKLETTMREDNQAPGAHILQYGDYRRFDSWIALLNQVSGMVYELPEYVVQASAPRATVPITGMNRVQRVANFSREQPEQFIWATDFSCLHIADTPAFLTLSLYPRSQDDYAEQLADIRVEGYHRETPFDLTWADLPTVVGAPLGGYQYDVFSIHNDQETLLYTVTKGAYPDDAGRPLFKYAHQEVEMAVIYNGSQGQQTVSSLLRFPSSTQAIAVRFNDTGMVALNSTREERLATFQDVMAVASWFRRGVTDCAANILASTERAEPQSEDSASGQN